MPNPARRPRGSSGRGRAKPASTGQARPAPSRPRREDPYAALDAALTTAAASPPPAATTFGALGLDDRLVSALEAADISEPFAIQARALPDALAGRDVLGRAQTGSGKTLAFGLPLLTRLAGSTQRRRERAPRGLILVPTRELAEQVAGVLGPFGRKIGVRTITVYGGVSIVRHRSFTGSCAERRLTANTEIANAEITRTTIFRHPAMNGILAFEGCEELLQSPYDAACVGFLIFRRFDR